MKRLLSIAAAVGCLALTGCAVVPAGPYYGGHGGYGYAPRTVIVAPAVPLPPPVVIRPYRRDDDGWRRDRRDWGRDRRGWRYDD